MVSRYGFLTLGNFLLKTESRAPISYESTFVQGIRDRALELYRRNAWKTGASDGKMVSRAALWGANPKEPNLVRIQFNSVSPRGEGDGFVYSIVSPEISGVLARKEDIGSELRLLHTADFRVLQVASQPGTGKLAMSVRHHGCTVLATMSGDGQGLTEITQGETFDESPSWVPSNQSQIVFQSAGVARNEHGQEVGLSPYAIQIYDLDSSRISTLLEDPERDLLAPKVSTDGGLYFIRRPYHLGRAPRSVWRWIEDILLFPYRLLYAFFQFLNIFTMMYTGKPLSHSGPFMKKQADQVQMTLWGNLIEARKTMLGEEKQGDSLVPPSWELCRKNANGEIEVLAKSVLSFDLDLDGNVLFTDGSTISHLSPSGHKTQLHKAPMIQQVVFLPLPAARSEVNPVEEQVLHGARHD
jgi:hypothetical protein